MKCIDLDLLTTVTGGLGASAPKPAYGPVGARVLGGQLGRFHSGLSPNIPKGAQLEFFFGRNPGWGG